MEHKHGTYKGEHHHKGMSGHRPVEKREAKEPTHYAHHHHPDSTGEKHGLPRSEHHDHHLGAERGKSHLTTAVGELHRQEPGISRGIIHGQQENAREPRERGASAGVRQRPHDPKDAPKW